MQFIHDGTDDTMIFSGIKESKMGAQALTEDQDWNHKYCCLQALSMASKDVASSYIALFTDKSRG